MAEHLADDVDGDAGDDDSTPARSRRTLSLGSSAHHASPPWPPTALVDRARLWVAWIGPGRLAGAVGATLVVAGVGWWLLRSPALPTEAALPTVSHAAAVPSSPLNGSGLPPTALSGPAVSEPAAVVVVHVTGAVNQPGVYELRTGQRVDDALAAAGGPTPDADSNSLNLAAPVVDGDRIEVPVVGQAPVGAAEGPGSGHTHATADDAAASAASPVDLNRADASALDGLPGIGPATAAAIIDHRTQNGPFASVDDLLDVPGIGPAKLEAIRELVTT